MTEFIIDPDIRAAKTLPSNFYTDKRFFESSKEKIFARSWQFAGRLDEFENLKPLTLLPDLLDEPILLSKTNDGVNCLSNVCTHRGKILVDEPCVAGLIRCGYHGRRFDLNGKFLSMPEFANVKNFPTEEDDLKNIPFATRGGFAFASIDPYAPFDEFVDDAVVGLEGLEPERLSLVSSTEYGVNAHWALYCENYLEGFHIPFVHRSLNEIVDYGNYTTETFRFSSLQTGFDGRGDVAARYLFIFPNLMFNFYLW